MTGSFIFDLGNSLARLTNAPLPVISLLADLKTDICIVHLLKKLSLMAIACVYKLVKVIAAENGNDLKSVFKRLIDIKKPQTTFAALL